MVPVNPIIVINKVLMIRINLILNPIINLQLTLKVQSGTVKKDMDQMHPRPQGEDRTLFHMWKSILIEPLLKIRNCKHQYDK